MIINKWGNCLFLSLSLSVCCNDLIITHIFRVAWLWWAFLCYFRKFLISVRIIVIHSLSIFIFFILFCLSIPYFSQHPMHLHQRCSLIGYRLEYHSQHFNEFLAVFQINQLFNILLKFLLQKLTSLVSITVIYWLQESSMENSHAQTEYSLFSKGRFIFHSWKFLYFFRSIVDSFFLNCPIVFVYQVIAYDL